MLALTDEICWSLEIRWSGIQLYVFPSFRDDRVKTCKDAHNRSCHPVRDGFVTPDYFFLSYFFIIFPFYITLPIPTTRDGKPDLDYF